MCSMCSAVVCAHITTFILDQKYVAKNRESLTDLASLCNMLFNCMYGDDFNLVIFCVTTTTGFVIDFIPFPIINGFTSAAAITIALGQVKVSYLVY